MKSEIFNRPLLHMQELSEASCEMINGGETLWYWLAYGVGYFVGGLNGRQSSGQQLYNSAFN